MTKQELENKVNETHKIIVGNGDPEKGLCRQVAIIGERQGKVMELIKGLNENHNVLLGEITRVGANLGKLEAGINGEKTAKRRMIQNGLTLLGFIVVIFVAFLTHSWTSNKQANIGKEIKEVQVDQDTLRADLKRSRGIVIAITPEVIDMNKQKAFADSLIKTLNK